MYVQIGVIKRFVTKGLYHTEIQLADSYLWVI